MDFLAQIINGLHVGSIYALVALGYNMVYGIVQLINFAHGDIIMVGAYAAYVALIVGGLPIWAAFLISIVVCAILGMVIERVAYRRLLVKNAPRISLLITAIGVSIFLQNLAQLIFTSSGKSFPNLFDVAPIMLGDMQIGFITILTILVSVVLMIGLQILVKDENRKGNARNIGGPGRSKAHGYQYKFRCQLYVWHRQRAGGCRRGTLCGSLSGHHAVHGLYAGSEGLCGRSAGRHREHAGRYGRWICTGDCRKPDERVYIHNSGGRGCLWNSDFGAAV